MLKFKEKTLQVTGKERERERERDVKKKGKES